MSLSPQCRKCRQRRVRCDSRQPACAKCVQKGVACPGYSTSRPLRWQHYLPRETIQARSAPKALNMANLYTRNDDVAPGEVVADVIAYYNSKLAPDLSVFERNGFGITMAAWLASEKTDRHLQICIVTLHKALQQQTTWPPALNSPSSAYGGAKKYLDLFHHHQASAARLLQDQIISLHGNKAKFNETVLASIGLFLSLQIQESAYGAWRTHLHGAKSMLDLWRGGDSLPGSDELLYFHLMIVDIYGTTTSALDKPCPKSVSQHQTYLSWLSQLQFDSCNSLTPVPWEILRATIFINILRAAGQAQCRVDGGEGIEMSADEILLLIQAFDPLSWAEEVTLKHETPASTSTNPHHDTHMEGWASLAACFQSATILYLILSVNPALHSLEPEKWNDARDSTYISLVVSIQFLFTQRSDQGKWHKYIFWPMVIAGVEAAVRGDGAFFGYLTKHLRMLTADLGTMAMSEAGCFLENFWEECMRTGPGLDGRVKVNWDWTFTPGPIFLM
ncbi:hypothetical protein BJX63DRAFT_26134 [Aspergillus granulosus]|uniref:Zn(2)-C6 fungal-type domain-containing protein n=1 Tax=Aspergillus granulosus TaxID=176169 RepID=A0ABR4GZM5_9EURO